MSIQSKSTLRANASVTVGSESVIPAPRAISPARSFARMLLMCVLIKDYSGINGVLRGTDCLVECRGDFACEQFETGSPPFMVVLVVSE
jgi:hypothetical protein